MHRYRSENSLHNILNYAIIELSVHFLIGNELNKNEYNILSDNTKYAIKLVKKLSNTDKVQAIYPDQKCSCDNTSLFVHSENTKYKKMQ